jgi:glycosyltransferase involved in cell wall biosynthesis
MKIAQIVCAYPPYAGGMAQSAYNLGRILQEDYEVTTFTPSTIKPWLQYGHGAFLPQLLWRLRKFDYIYLHYPFFGTAEIVWLFKLFCPRPKLIIHYHMDVQNSHWLTKLLSWPSRLIRNSLFEQAAIIISASLDYVANSAIKDYYLSHTDKFRELPFGLDVNRFRPKTETASGSNFALAKAKEIVNFINQKFINKGRLNLLFVGGLDRAHYFKGVDILLTALAQLPRHDWRLNIVGSGDLQSEYAALSAKLQLTKQVTFSGKLINSDLIRAYQAADVLILPSINNNEAFGIVLIEALACGVPVIASDLPGVRRVFTDHQEGWLVQPGNIQDLTQRLNYVLDHSAERTKAAKAARQLAELKYDEKIIGAQLKKIFYENRPLT